MVRFSLCVSVAACGLLQCRAMRQRENFVISPIGPLCNTAESTIDMSNTFKIGRDTDTGRFKPLDEVRKRDIVERVPKPGRGDTKPTKK